MRKVFHIFLVAGGIVSLLMGTCACAEFKNGEVMVGFGDASEEIVTALPEAELVSSKPSIDINSWEYVLVNADHPIGEYAPDVAEIEGIPLDYRIVDAMTSFVNDARNAGVPVYISSGYRDYQTQAYLNTLQQQMGYSKEEADKIVAPAGTSEHQTGLASDITDYYREIKNDELESTDTFQWMSKHCQEYGFIVRYPKDKEDITGIIYEPWHYRYVGVEAATFIMEHGLCLEEFVGLYEK